MDTSHSALPIPNITPTINKLVCNTQIPLTKITYKIIEVRGKKNENKLDQNPIFLNDDTY
jgi:hypothetical protein